MHKYAPYAPPISLADLARTVGVPALGQLVAALPGAQPQDVKRNETWRYVFRSCTLIGYKQSAVVAGEQAPQVCAVARAVRAAVLGLVPASPNSGTFRSLPEPPKADPGQDLPETLNSVPGRSLVEPTAQFTEPNTDPDRYLVVPTNPAPVRDLPKLSLLSAGASYDYACDWTVQPWALLWVAHRRALGPQVRVFGEQRDPFAWAVGEGLANG